MATKEEKTLAALALALLIRQRATRVHAESGYELTDWPAGHNAGVLEGFNIAPDYIEKMGGPKNGVH